ncbi:hypothetical protein GGE65_007967 [Skermanella aerolata]
MFDTMTVGAELPDGASTQTAFETKDYGATCESELAPMSCTGLLAN